MFSTNFLMDQNARLRDENAELQDTNAALMHILAYILPELGAVRIPRNIQSQKSGKIEFRPAPRDCVDIVYIEAPERYSNTGDPIYDRIFR